MKSSHPSNYALLLITLLFSKKLTLTNNKICFPLIFSRTKFAFTGFNYVVNFQVVNKYIDQGVAELVPGVLFIDEVS